MTHWQDFIEGDSTIDLIEDLNKSTAQVEDISRVRVEDQKIRVM